jgi:perosamine synthetase
VIPLSIPNFEGNEQKYVDEAVSQGWVSSGGAFVDKLEKKLAEYTNTPLAVACQSGTSALHMALVELGVKRDDLVITPTLTFIAAVNPITYVGAQPVFMDCDDSLCMDADKLRSFCENECTLKDDTLVHNSDGKRVRAIIVVHVFGNMANMVDILKTAKKYHLYVIEDATEAIGTYYTSGELAGCHAGTMGDIGALSFNGNKIVTTGGGGAVLSKYEKRAAHIKYLSTQAKDDLHFYVHNEIGFNYRMTNVQAALGVAQMEELETFVERKNKNYDLYRELLEPCEKYYILDFAKNIRSNKWFYSLVVEPEKIGLSVKDIIIKLGEEGVQTRPIWGLNHEQKPYVDCLAYNIEKAKYYSDRVINLPCSTNITQEEIKTVCETIKRILA